MKKQKKYYLINTPRTENKHTGNFCISISALQKFDRDFLFNQTINNRTISKVIPKEYVKDHIFWLHTNKEDIVTGEKFKFYFPVISYNDIMNA